MSASTAARSVPLRVPSTSPGTALPTAAPWSSAATRILRLVPQRRSQAAKTPFAAVLVVALIGGLLGLLLLNTLVAQDSFRLHELAKNARSLQQQEQELARQVQAKQAPADLAGNAVKLGMVPGGPPAFLRLSDGRVLGQPTVGKALPKPAVEKPAPKPAAKPAPKPAQPSGSTTWTAPRQTPPPTSTGATR